MDLSLNSRRAIICGSSRGLGFACAMSLAREGVETTLVARSEESLQTAARQIRDATGQVVHVCAADISNLGGIEAVLSSCESPDILIINAGGPPSRSYEILEDEDWRAAFATTFYSAEALIRHIVPGMADRGWGRVVAITSVAVRQPVPDLELSTAPRMALTGYIAGVARKVAAKGVTVNCVLPGPILTERIEDLGKTAEALIAQVPMGRAGTPEEFAAACTFLCSEQAGFITGQNLLVDGGLCQTTI